MLLSQHAIIGAGIAVATGNPYLGFVGGLLSHNLLDSWPHIDCDIFHRHEPEDEWGLSVTDYFTVVLDFTVTGLLLLYIINNTGLLWLPIIGAFGGSLPDIVDNVPWWNKYFRHTRIGKIYHRFHNRWHWHWRKVNWWLISIAIILQVLVTIGGLWLSGLNY